MKEYTFTAIVLSTIIFALIIFLLRKNKLNNRAKESTALVPVKIKVEGLTKFQRNKTEEEKYADEIERVLSGNDSGHNHDTPKIAKTKNDEGVTAFNNGEIDKAIAFYHDAIKIAPDYHLAIYNLGNSYFAIEDYKNAIKYFEKVILLDPKDEYAYYNLAMSYYRIGDLKTATIYYQKAVEISPGDYTTHYNLAKVYEKLENIDLAIEAYHKAIALKNDYANAYYNLAELLKYKGKNKQAIKEYENYLKYNPNAQDSSQVKKTIVSLMMR